MFGGGRSQTFGYFSGVKIGKNSKVIDSIIMADTEIGDNVIIQKAIVANDVKVLDNTVIGDGKDIVVIGEKRVVKSEPVK